MDTLNISGVSSVIICYNAEETIEDVVFSIKNQNINFNFELFAIDDASTDNTFKKLMELDVNVIKHDKNRGLAYSLNEAITSAKYKYVMIQYGDIVLTNPNTIKISRQELRKDLKIVVAIIPTLTSSDIFEKYDVWGKLIHGWRLQRIEQSLGCAMYNKVLLKSLNLWFDQKSFRVALEDWDFKIRLEKRGYKKVILPILNEHRHDYKTKGLASILIKSIQQSEGGGVVFRRYPLKVIHQKAHYKYWFSPLLATLYGLTLLYSLITTYTWLKLLLFSLSICYFIFYSLKTYKWLPQKKLVLLAPITKLIIIVVGICGFWKGLLTGKQSL